MTVNTDPTAGSAGTDTTDVTDQVDTTEVDVDEDDKPLFSQKQVDAMIEKRIAREKKKASKALAQQPQQQPPSPPVDGGQDLASMLQALVAQLQGGQVASGQGVVQPAVASSGVSNASTGSNKAFSKLVTAHAKAEALTLGFRDEYVSDVLALANLSSIEVDDDGEFEETDVTKALKKVAKKHPSFLKTQPTAPPVKGGVAGKKDDSSLSDIEKARRSFFGIE